jgi:S1-C subfamily serine protease
VHSPKLVDTRARTALAADTLDALESVSRVPRSLAALYRKVAPATVIVRSPGGIGTGVIIDSAGWVLTNYHAVSAGETRDFFTRVKVLLGRLDERTGRMVLRDEEQEAYVYKIDRLRDLALLRLTEPAESLPAIKLAAEDPLAGQQVLSVGHAAAGLLWTPKPGEIIRLAPLGEQLQALVTFPRNAAGQDAAQRFEEYLQRQQLGLIIQSTCRVLPGDSGGPLVNADGELVGLNAFSSEERQTATVRNYHVHRAQLDKFVAARPAKPIRLIPDPWLDGGGDAGYQDGDGDGRVDLLVLKGRRPCRFCPRQSLAMFVDVDQDSYDTVVVLPALTEVYERRNFDAELVLLRLEDRTLSWYDTDNDGDYDILLVDDASSGRSTRAYRIRSNGDIDPWSSLAHGATIRLSLFSDTELRERLSRIAAMAFPSDFVEDTSGWKGELPHPLGRAGQAGAVDLNRDGTNDAVLVASAFGERLLVDADQNWARHLEGSLRLDELIESNTVDAEVTVVSQGTHTWVWYDTDDDQRFDLVLHSSGLRLYVATEAWRVQIPEGLVSAPEHTGRKLIRAGLLPDGGPGAEVLRSMIAKRGFLSLMSASGDEQLETFPDPVKDHRGRDCVLVELKGAPRAVVSIQGRGSDGYLMDLDGDTGRGQRRRPDLAKLAADGQFDAELAYFHRNGLSWVYYDADNQAGYDVVLYTSEPGLGLAQRGFRIDAQGSVTLDPALANQPMIRPGLLQRGRLGQRLRQLAQQLFDPRWVQR